MRNDLSTISGNRVQMQQLKAETFTTQILERILIRKKQLESLLEEELEHGSRLAQLEETSMQSLGSLGLETTLTQKLSDIARQKRDADQQCWRDVGMVIPHLLGAVEALQAAQGRESILTTPSAPSTKVPPTNARLFPLKYHSQPKESHYVQTYTKRLP
mgnify:CR=1 FL=1